MIQRPTIIIGAFLLLISSFPLFLMAREYAVGQNVFNRYELSTARTEFGYDFSLNSKVTHINGYTIEIVETPTGEKEQLEEHEIEWGDIPRDIVMAQIVVNGEKVGEPHRIMLGAREDHTRYHRYIEIMRVKEKEKERIAIIVTQAMDSFNNSGEWEIIWLDGDNISIETYKRGDNYPLATRMVNHAGLTDMSFGYYSDINHYYPTLFMPLLYPWGTGLFGALLLLYGVFAHFIGRANRS